MTIMSKLLALSVTLFWFSNGQTTFSYDQTTQQQILDWHNAERAQTANGNEYCSSGSGVWDTTCPAGSIRTLKWDSTLASVAQDWAETLANDDCAWGHSQNEWRESRLLARNPAFGYPISGMYDYIGENIARSGSTGGYPTGEGVWNNWVDRESGLFMYGSRTVQSSGGSYGTNPDTQETGNGQIGHYTQIVADRSEYLGCGFAGNRCYSESSGYWFYYSYTVCQYYPGGNFGSTYENPYTTSSNGQACQNCDTGYSCNSAGLCDNGAADNFDTPIPTANTPNPTPKPTPQPTTPQPTRTEQTVDPGDSSSSSGIVTLASIYTGFNNVAWPAITNSYTELSGAYGPVTAYGYNLLLVYGNGRWRIINKDTYDSQGYFSTFCYCICTDCAAADCDNWNRYIDSVIVLDSAAYSSSSSDSNKNRELYDGLVIGLAIAVGVFVISGLIYYCVKRRNSKKTQYNIVEMNNEISNHEYVTMDN